MNEPIEDLRAKTETAFEDIREQAEKIFDDVLKQSKQTAKSIRAEVKNQPLRSVAVAAAIGFLAGLLLSGRRDD